MSNSDPMALDNAAKNPGHFTKEQCASDAAYLLGIKPETNIVSFDRLHSIAANIESQAARIAELEQSNQQLSEKLKSETAWRQALDHRIYNLYEGREQLRTQLAAAQIETIPLRYLQSLKGCVVRIRRVDDGAVILEWEAEHIARGLQALGNLGAAITGEARE